MFVLTATRCGTCGMRDYCVAEGAVELRFFHISTDGRDNGAVHFCDEDYHQAVIISAIVAYQYGVRILCFCHMTTHSHFLVYCDLFETAAAFAEEYKRRYALYISQKYTERKVYKDVDCTPCPVQDFFHLRNCVSYILLNPVAAGICRFPEEYRWSSFDAYFNTMPLSGRPVSSFGVRELRKLLRTRRDISGSGLMIGCDGVPIIKSFLDYGFVERLFGSKSNFYKSLALTDSAVEEAKYVAHSHSYSDTEVIAECLNIARRLFDKETLHMLTKEEKHRLLVTLRKKIRVTPRRIARILRLKLEEVESIIGK